MKRFVIFVVVMAFLVLVGRNYVGASTTGSSSQDYDIASPVSSTSIPKEALRLRIIANSDSAKDQELKREVRDAVVVECGSLLKNAKNSDEARQIVMAHIPEFTDIALAVIHARGYNYSVQTEVGKVPFPTKVYGNRVYPAGNYEALRIIIGKGLGQNWWCVLFPPLCFVDISDGDAVPNTGAFPDLPPVETINVPTADGKTTPVAVRLASIDYGEELLRAVSQVLHHK